MTVEFKIKPHSIRRDREVVEVWIDGAFVATIVPLDSGDGVKLISKYIGTLSSDYRDGLGELHVKLDRAIR